MGFGVAGREHLAGGEAALGRHEHEGVPAGEVGQRLDAVAAAGAEAGLGAGQEEGHVGAERRGRSRAARSGRARRAARAAPRRRPTSRRPGRPRPGSASRAARAASRPAPPGRRSRACPPQTLRRPSRRPPRRARARRSTSMAWNRVVSAVVAVGCAAAPRAGTGSPWPGARSDHGAAPGPAARSRSGGSCSARRPGDLGRRLGQAGQAQRVRERLSAVGERAVDDPRRPLPLRPEARPRPAAERDEHRVDVRLGHEHAAATPAGRRCARRRAAPAPRRRRRPSCPGCANSRSPISRCTITQKRSIVGSARMSTGVATP